MRKYRRRLSALLSGAVVLTTACAGDPVARAHQYGASGDRYAAHQQLKEAVIEYGNAVKVQPAWAEAHYKRARAYLSLDDPSHAYQSYARAAELQPSNLDAQLQAASLLVGAGEFEAAQARATST